VSEVVGIADNAITLSDIYVVDYAAGFGPDGRFAGQLEPTGIRPTFCEHLSDVGIVLPSEIFGSDELLSSGSGW
jgi:pilus assembly protein CpaF